MRHLNYWEKGREYALGGTWMPSEERLRRSGAFQAGRLRSLKVKDSDRLPRPAGKTPTLGNLC